MPSKAKASREADEKWFGSRGEIASLVVAVLSLAVASWAAYTSLTTANRQTDIAHNQTDIAQEGNALKKLLSSFGRDIIQSQNVVQRDVMKTIGQRVQNWQGHATIVSGLFRSGKSVAIAEVLRGVRGVVQMSVRNDKWEDELYSKLGVSSAGMLEDVLKEAREELRADGDNLSKAPIIILDVPRKSKADIDTISTFAKEYASDGGPAHIVVVASSATTALGFDAGGPDRRFDIWVGDTGQQIALA